jgi:hypothetical protein
VSFIASEVAVNGERLACAGGSAVGVLAATLTLSRRYAQGDERVVELRVGGMTSPGPDFGAEHVDWVQIKDVSVGTEITFKVVSASEADPPATRRPHTAQP